MEGLACVASLPVLAGIFSLIALIKHDYLGYTTREAIRWGVGFGSALWLIVLVCTVWRIATGVDPGRKIEPEPFYPLKDGSRPDS